jgi:hypothetical protein
MGSAKSVLNLNYNGHKQCSVCTEPELQWTQPVLSVLNLNYNGHKQCSVCTEPELQWTQAVLSLYWTWTTIDTTSANLRLDEIFSVYRDMWRKQRSGAICILRPSVHHLLFTCIKRQLSIHTIQKVKQSLYKSGQTLSAWGCNISRHSAREGGTVVSLTHRPPLPPENIPGTHYR